MSVYQRFKKLYGNDSIFLVVIRVMKSLEIRFRGQLYKSFNVFSGSPGRVVIGRFLTLKGGKCVHLWGNIKIGSNCRIEVFNISDHAGAIVFGCDVSLGNNVHIACCNEIILGKNVLLGSNILITDHSHGRPRDDLGARSPVPPTKRPLSSKGPIMIGDNVWICDAVTILSGVKIGDGAIIPVGSTVRADVPAYTIYKES